MTVCLHLEIELTEVLLS